MYLKVKSPGFPSQHWWHPLCGPVCSASLRLCGTDISHRAGSQDCAGSNWSTMVKTAVKITRRYRCFCLLGAAARTAASAQPLFSIPLPVAPGPFPFASTPGNSPQHLQQRATWMLTGQAAPAAFPSPSADSCVAWARSGPPRTPAHPEVSGELLRK